MMKYNLGGFLLGVLLTIPQVYFSQELLESSSYTVSKELYSSESGLPGREVNCAMQDSDGFIWLGTKNGLSRFDGENFKSFTVQNGLQSNIVASIKQVNGNQLLIEYSVPYLPYKFDGLKDLINFQNFQIVKSQNSILNSSIDKIDLVKGLAFISADLCFDRKFVIESGDVLFLSTDGQMQVLVSEMNGVWYFERNITVQLMKAVDFFSTKKMC